MEACAGVTLRCTGLEVVGRAQQEGKTLDCRGRDVEGGQAGSEGWKGSIGVVRVRTTDKSYRDAEQAASSTSRGKLQAGLSYTVQGCPGASRMPRSQAWGLQVPGAASARATPCLAY